MEESKAVAEALARSLVTAVFMAIVANRLVEGLVKPLYQKLGWDHFTLIYVAWAVGGVLVWWTGINLFATWIPDPLKGQVLSAVVAGGGANLLADLFGTQSAVITAFKFPAQPGPGQGGLMNAMREDRP